MNAAVAYQNYADEFASAARSAFLILIGGKLQTSIIDPNTNYHDKFNVVATLEFRSTSEVGTLMLYFPRLTLLTISNKLTGETSQSLAALDSSAAGEILNIIYANARVTINKAGADFKPALPAIRGISAENHSHQKNADVLAISCKSDFGVFYLEMSARKIE